MRDSLKNLVYPLLIVIQCAIFGASFVFVKSLLESGIPTFLLMGIRFAIGAVFLFILSVIINHSAFFERLRAELVRGTIAGLVLFFSFALQTFGANTTTPAKSGLFTDLFVIFVPLIMIFVTKKFSLKPLILALLAFFGVMILLNIFSEEVSFVIGDLLTMLCGFVFAVHFIVLEKFAVPKNAEEKLNPYNFTLIQLFTVSVLSAIVSLVIEQGSYELVKWENSIVELIFLGVMASSIAYLLQFLAQEKISAQTTSVLSCSEAIFAITFSLIFSFDEFSWRLIFGAGTIVVAMVLSSIDFESQIKSRASRCKLLDDFE